jgi:hypothetical protein
MQVIRTGGHHLARFAVLALALGAGCQTTQRMLSFLPGQPAQAPTPQSVAEAEEASKAASVAVDHDGVPHDRAPTVSPSQLVHYPGKSLFSVPGYSPAVGSAPRSVPSRLCASG